MFSAAVVVIEEVFVVVDVPAALEVDVSGRTCDY